MELAGKIALVTGASRGIGKAIALSLSQAGAIVIGTATTESGAQAITDYLAPTGRGLLLNVTNPSELDACLNTVVAEFGAIDILVNNAGITRDNLAMRIKDSEWNEVIDTNLSAVFHLSKAVMRGMMKARWGRIINITSIIGTTGNAGQANYAAAKAGVAGMTKALAKELGSRNITVNCVAPGFIDTDMTRALGEETKTALLAQIPLDRLGQPEDIANAVKFLASPSSSYITGTTLHVNGGMFM